MTSSKITWKSILGVLSMVGGAITAATSATSPIHLPTDISAALVAVGGGIVLAERIIEGLEGSSSSTSSVAADAEQKVKAAYEQGKADVAGEIAKVFTQRTAQVFQPTPPPSAHTANPAPPAPSNVPPQT